MLTSPNPFAFLLVVWALLTASPAACLAQYTFSRVVDTTASGTTNPFIDFTPASINSSRQVAFVGIEGIGPLPTNQSVYRATGTNLTTIATIDAFFNRFGTDVGPSLNDAGQVAFHATRQAAAGGGTGIFRGSGGAVTTIATTPGNFTLIAQQTSIMPNGTVAFGVVFLDNQQGILTGSGTGTTTVATTQGSPYSGFAPPSINGNNQIAFRGDLPSAAQAILLASGGNTTPLVDTAGQFNSFGTITPITSAATIAFTAILDDATTRGVFTVTSGGTVTPRADSTGQYATFGNVSISPDGSRLAFFATRDAGGSGIYTGPNPTTDKVIQTGDALDGSTVTALEFSPYAVNNSGDIVFNATLADGRQGVYVAAPIPEPSAILVVAGLAGLALRYRRMLRKNGTPG